jgi:hypothetical protein
MATAALVVAAVGTVGSIVQQRRASKEQRRQNKVSNKIAANKRARDIRRQIAARRVQVAEAQASGFAFGVEGGTAVQGAVGGLTSDFASSIGAANQQFTGQQALASSQNRVSSLMSSANTFQGVGQLAGMFSGGEGSEGAQNRAAISNLVGV